VTHALNPEDITSQEAAMLKKLSLVPAAALVLLYVSAAPALASSEVGRGSLFLDGRVVGTVVPPAQMPAGTGQGIAIHKEYKGAVAFLVEIDCRPQTVNRRIRDAYTGPRVTKVVCAVDTGPIINPSGARAQLEGGVVQALSAALKERITIAGGAVEQRNFDSYRVLRINEAPLAIETHFIETDTHPTGMGEAAMATLAPALAMSIAVAKALSLSVATIARSPARTP